ncbi:hypothetical protein FZEAL_5448 [Fusarium zealandicum]|uniref:Uncharacterized protein n=1 Tax=Fusarium zealandicum TaxID=1053134 RepID=A0A8H4UJQ8_9HYPO|nr:hypothetical protein FZEAL_5448 [Fusarium zealandicum]
MAAANSLLRVRREDLNGSDGGGGNESDDGLHDAELRAKLNAQIVRSLGLDDNYAEPPPDLDMGNSHISGPKRPGDDASGGLGSPDVARDENEEEFTFRLFSSAPPAQKVVLEEDTGPTGDGGFVDGRPLSYYMVTGVSAQQKHEYAVAALSGDHILARSHDRAWGFELPWKVTKIAVTRNAKAGERPEDDTAKRPRRPGKKQRISLRKRAKIKEEETAAAAQKLMEKEEHVKDKKKRLNRLKKLRKRAKAKEMKQATKGEGGVSDDSDSDSAGSE